MGTITKVDFYQGTTLIGTASAAPYTFSWMSVPAGSYRLTAVATNDAGTATTSAAVTITVDAPPAVSLSAPANNAVFAAPGNIALVASANDATGAITRVDFYQGTTLIGTATAAPYSFAWTNVAAGLYSLSAVATNDAGMSVTSSAIAVTVDAPPAVSLTSPVSGASFTAPATVTLTASASDAVGTIARVDFYQGTTLIGSASASPYSFSWTNVAAGSYSLTAVATNDAGTATTSATVSVTVKTGIAQMYYIEVDHLNTPRLIADATGTTVWRWDNQEPFGNDTPNGDPNSTGTTFDFPLRFPGQYADKETNISYNYFRDYDPVTGRYVRSDPIGLVGGLNTYAYVGGNPLNRRDATGLILIPPSLLLQYLPAPVLNQLTNFALYVQPERAAAAALAALDAYQYTVAVNLAINAGMSAAAVAGAGYGGYQVGTAINQAIENAYGQNAGGVLYDLLHPTPGQVLSSSKANSCPTSSATSNNSGKSLSAVTGQPLPPMTRRVVDRD